MENKLIYKITVDDLVKVLKYVQDNYSEYFAGDRKPEIVKNNILIGKLGEVVYSNIFSNFIYNDYSERGPNGYDFFLKNGNRVDVKTIDKKWKKRVYFKFGDFYDFDELALISLSKKYKGTYLGSLSREDAIKNKKYDLKNRAYYVDVNLFKIENLGYIDDSTDFRRWYK